MESLDCVYDNDVVEEMRGTRSQQHGNNEPGCERGSGIEPPPKVQCTRLRKQTKVVVAVVFYCCQVFFPLKFTIVPTLCFLVIVFIAQAFRYIIKTVLLTYFHRDWIVLWIFI